MKFEIGDLVSVNGRQGYIEDCLKGDNYYILDTQSVKFDKVYHENILSLIKRASSLKIKELSFGSLNDGVILYKCDNDIVIILDLDSKDIFVYHKKYISHTFEPDINKSISSLIDKKMFFDTPLYEQYKKLIPEKVKEFEVYNIKDLSSVDTMLF
jgi:hypothetical protein